MIRKAFINSARCSWNLYKMMNKNTGKEQKHEQKHGEIQLRFWLNAWISTIFCLMNHCYLFYVNFKHMLQYQMDLSGSVLFKFFFCILKFKISFSFVDKKKCRLSSTPPLILWTCVSPAAGQLCVDTVLTSFYISWPTLNTIAPPHNTRTFTKPALASQGNCSRVLDYIADLRWYLEIICLTSRLEVLADFLEKGKVPATTEETREEERPAW